MRLWERKADLGLTGAQYAQYAQYNLAVMYYNSLSVDMNWHKGFDWYEKAAD